MANLKARLLLLVAYVVSVAVVVSVERYWNSSGYRLSDLVSPNNELAAAVLLFAVIGLLFTGVVFAAGLTSLASRALASHRPCCEGGAHCASRHQESPNSIDVSVHPTDTTVAAGGPALVAPRYNVSLVHLAEPRPPAPSCPQQEPYSYPSSISQTGPSIKVEPKYYTRD
uniref:Putative secreted mucin n=1 Tax=Amblyomma triste TaxID=251400 RepID=A0A023G2M7_AMBTT